MNLAERTGAWQPKLQHWPELITFGRADGFKQTALLRLLRTAPRLRNHWMRAALTNPFYALCANKAYLTGSTVTATSPMLERAK